MKKEQTNNCIKHTEFGRARQRNVGNVGQQQTNKKNRKKKICLYVDKKCPKLRVKKNKDTGIKREH